MSKRAKIILVAFILLAALGGVLRMSRSWNPSEESTTAFRFKRVPRRIEATEMNEKNNGLTAGKGGGGVNGLAGQSEEDSPDELVPGSCLFRLDNPQDQERLQRWAAGRGIHVDGIQALGAFRLSLSQEDLDDLWDSLPDLVSSGAQEGVFLLPEPPGENSGGGESLSFYGTYRDFLGVNSQDATRGQGVKIALIDTGLLSHEDFDGVRVSALSIDGNAMRPFSYSGGTHATSVLSILAGNAHGITADATILSIPIVGSDGIAREFDLASAIALAVDNGADVISISLGGETGSPVLEAAVRYASEAGVVIVAAAGNDGVDRVSYPAAYADVIAVGAVNNCNQYMDFSNSGDNLDVMAPGVGLEAASADHEWTLFSGTSAAVPCVSGVIANYLSSHPQDSTEDVIHWLETTCTDIDSAGRDFHSGQGSVDAWLYENHDVAGLTDAALTAIRVEQTEDGQFEILMNVQNKGTSDLDVVNLLTRVGKSENTIELRDLKAFDSMEVSIPITLPKDAMEMEVFGMVILPDVTDLRPENQGAHAILRFSETPEE